MIESLISDQDLLKHTEKNHPDYANLDNALNKINEVVEYVNERKRLAENLQRILEIQDQIDFNESVSASSPDHIRLSLFGSEIHVSNNLID